MDDYVARAAPELRPDLEKLRRTIRSAAPDAEEVISYGLPAVKGIRVLVYYGAFRHHLSLFPGSAEARRQFAKELKPWAGGKGTVRFTVDHPLPAALIKRIVRFRLREDRARSPERPGARPTRA